MRARRAWTLGDDMWLIRWDGFEAYLMAMDLDRTVSSIYQRRHFLKSPEGQERLAKVMLAIAEEDGPDQSGGVL
jgi:hypothetical protein